MLTTVEALEMLLFLGACASLIAAWRWEGLGGALAIALMGVFYIVELATAGRLPRGWAFLTVAAAGALFVISRWAGRDPQPASRD